MAEQDVKPAPKATKTKKVATTKTATEKSAAKKSASAKKTAPKKEKSSTTDLQLHYRRIEISAYFIAEKDGFSGNPVDYWIAAEAEITKKGG
ncbi:MAG: DUF2934 domain-containing protein [Betaproteobacteria bacterium]|nr:DUF2934 domain-containing protein [Betaproteobacteria bacterium]